MLFLFADEGVHRFWMKNTMIPLDMVWMDADGRVLFVSADTPPCKADPCPNYGPDRPPRASWRSRAEWAARRRSWWARSQVPGRQVEIPVVS